MLRPLPTPLRYAPCMHLHFCHYAEVQMKGYSLPFISASCHMRGIRVVLCLNAWDGGRVWNLAVALPIAPRLPLSR